MNTQNSWVIGPTSFCNMGVFVVFLGGGGFRILFVTCSYIWYNIYGEMFQCVQYISHICDLIKSPPQFLLLFFALKSIVICIYFLYYKLCLLKADQPNILKRGQFYCKCCENVCRCKCNKWRQ